jgi:hypothetical protein
VQTVHCFGTFTGAGSGWATNEFTTDSVFFFLPTYAGSMLYHYGTGQTGEFGTLGTGYISQANALRIENDPSPIVIVSGTERVMPLGAGCGISIAMGQNTGVFRARRITRSDTLLTIAEIKSELDSDIHATTEWTVTGSRTIRLQAGVQNRNMLAHYNDAKTTISNLPDSEALGGWVFGFSGLALGVNVPAPMMRIHCTMRLQIELDSSTNHLRDSLPGVSAELLQKHLMASRGPTTHKGEVSAREAAEAGVAIPATR